LSIDRQTTSLTILSVLDDLLQVITECLAVGEESPVLSGDTVREHGWEEYSEEVALNSFKERCKYIVGVIGKFNHFLAFWGLVREFFIRLTFAKHNISDDMVLKA